MLTCLAFLVVSITINAITAQTVQTATECEYKQMNIQCPFGYLIDVQSVLYGRLDSNICGLADCNTRFTTCGTKISNTNCKLSTLTSAQTNADNYVKNRCNGKSSCFFNVANSVFSDPCNGIFKYSQVRYLCKDAFEQFSKSASVCEYRNMNLQCPTGGQINVESVFYGRLTRDTCGTDDECRELGFGSCNGILGSITCQADLTFSKNQVSALCNGQTSCSYLNGNGLFGDPCGGTLKYGQASWTCRDPVQTVTKCENQVVNINCGAGTIVMNSAFYGRQDSTTCATCGTNCGTKLANTACSVGSVKAQSYVEGQCNGKSSCTFTVNNAAFSDPCTGTLKYGVFSYTCVY